MNDKGYPNSVEGYTHSEDYYKNLEAQSCYFDEYLRQCNDGNHGPFSDWDGFLFHYYQLRAGLSSLLRNPDTMNDEDFVELCSTWEAQRFGYIDTKRIESLYSKLSLKPVFKENEIFKDMYGHFLKSVHSLFDGDFYTHDFFKIDR